MSLGIFASHRSGKDAEAEPVYAAPWLVQSVLAGASGSPAWTTPPVAGNLLVAIFRPTNATAVLDPTITGTGWTLIGGDVLQVGSNTGRAAWWMKVADGGDANPVMADNNSTPGTVDTRLLEFSGVEAVLDGPVSDTSGGAGVTVTSVALGPLTPTVPVLLLGLVAATGTISSGEAWTDGFTAITTASIRLLAGYKPVRSPSGSYSTTVSWVSPRGQGSGLAALKLKELSPAPDFTGGTVTEPGDGFRYHRFNSSGTLTMVSPGEVEVLVVAGGGGGGSATVSNRNGGGGGAGGVLNRFVTISATQAITVGAGGAAQTIGGDSSVGALVVATGGGRGGASTGGSQSGGSGGSGGGGSNGGGVGGAGTTGQGRAGGTGHASTGATNASGGGGGAVGAGATGAATSVGGAGGAGTTIFGVTVAGGGGGASSTGGVGGPGGTGGGGTGGNLAAAITPTAGTLNTGGGGGGSGASAVGTSPGGAGGSGLVIVRYPIAS